MYFIGEQVIRDQDDEVLGICLGVSFGRCLYPVTAIDVVRIIYMEKDTGKMQAIKASLATIPGLKEFVDHECAG